MLYDAAIRQLARAVELLDSNNFLKKDPSKIEQISKAVMKAEEIITELIVSLDFEQGGDISKNLFALYTWFNRELLEANIGHDMNRIKTVMEMLSDLRNTWNEVAGKYNAESASREAVGLDIAG